MTDLATLGLAIESSSAVKATSNLDQLTAASIKTEAAVTRVAAAGVNAGRGMSATAASAAQTARALATAAQANDNVSSATGRLTAAVQKLVQVQSGLATSLRAADIQAYGAELDRLRARFNPLFAAGQTYKSTLEDIRKAHRVGAISATEMADAVDRTKTAFVGQVQTLRGHTQAVDVASASVTKYGKAAKSNSFEVANLAAQFQDIAVTAAMGASPMQVALQQGTQISAAFGNQGAAASVKALGGAFLSVISPVSLITIAAVAAGVAMYQWLSSGKSGSEKLEDTFKRQGDALESLKELYGETTKAVNEFSTAGGNAFNRGQVDFQASKIQSQISDQGKSYLTTMKNGNGALNTIGSYFGGNKADLESIKSLSGDLAKFQEPVNRLIDSMRSGKTDVAGFNADLEAFYKKIAAGAGDADILRRQADAVKVIGDSVAGVSGNFKAFQDPINQLMVSLGEGSLDALPKFTEEVEKIGASSPALKKLADEAINLSDPLVKLFVAQQQLQQAKFNATEVIRNRVASEAGDDGSSYYKQREREYALEQKIADANVLQLNAITDIQKITAAGQVARAAIPAKGETQDHAAQVAEKEVADQLAAAYRAAAYERSLGYAKARGDANAEVELLGKTAAEVVGLRFEYEELTRVHEEAARTGHQASILELLDIQKTKKALEDAALAQQAYQNRVEDATAAAEQQRNRAVTDAQKVAAAGAVAGAAFPDATTPAEIAERNRKISMAEAATRSQLDTQYAESARQRKQAGDEALIQGREQISLIGKTTGEVAALQYQYQALAELRAQAFATGRPMDEAEIAAIKQRAAELGKLAEQTSALKAIDDINFDNQQIGRTQDEQKVYSQIRDIGLDINSVEGQRVATAIRQNQELQRQHDTMTTIADTLAGMFDSPIKGLDDFIGKLASGFAKIGQQNLQKAFDGILDGSIFSSVGKTVSSASASATAPVAVVDKVATGAVIAGGDALKASAVSLQQPIATFGQGASSLSGTISTIAAGIKQVESGGNYSALGPVTKSGDRAYGAYQVMGANVASWTKAATGTAMTTQEFLQNKSVQDAVATQQLTKSYIKFGNAADAQAVWFSGRPVDKAGNASDGYNTVAQYNAKIAAANASIPSQVKAGAADGVAAGIKDVNQTAQAAPAAAPGGANVGGSSLTLGSGLGAALGGFGMGTQSQSPVIGGLGGALSGFMAAGPIGAVVGGIAGVIGGIFGKSQQRKQEKQQAQATLDGNRGAIANYIAVGNNQGVGDYTSKIRDAYDKEVSLEAPAQKAGDKGLINQLRGAYNNFFNTTAIDWETGFNGMVDAYKSGLGPDSPFVKGNQAVEDLRDSLKNFVADAQTMRDDLYKNNPNNATNTPDQKATYDAVTAKMVAQAQEAAQKMALATIDGTRALTGMETTMQTLQGNAVGLHEALQQLGMTSDQAAKAISDSLNIAVGKLKTSYLQDVTASIGDKAGVGYLGDITSALQTFQTRLRDAAAVGLDGSLAITELNLSIKQIATDANLSATEVNYLSQMFPALADTLNSTLVKTVSITDAQSNLSNAYQDASGKIEDQIDALKSFGKSIQQFIDSIQVGSNSPLSPDKQVAEAARQFNSTAALAATGNTDAMDSLQTVAQTYLDQAKSYYASSTDYAAIFQSVKDTLNATKDSAAQQLTDSQKQLDTLKSQVDKLIDIDDSVMSVQDAINQLNSSQQKSFDALVNQMIMMNAASAPAISAAFQTDLGRAPSTSESSYWSNQINNGVSVGDAVTGIANTKSSIQSLYQSVLGRPADDTGLNFFLNSGKNLDQIYADLNWAKDHGGFSSGGYTGNGGVMDVAGVVHGQEFVNHAAATARYRPELEAMNRGTYAPSNDNSAVVAELQALRKEVAALKASTDKGNAIAVAGHDQTTSAVQQVAAVQGETNSNLKKVASGSGANRGR